MAVAVAVFLRLFFRRTRTGVAMRAVVDDPSLASLAGAPSGRISAYAWMIGVMFAGRRPASCSPRRADMNILTLTELVIYGYAAAVVGRLRSLPLTFLGAMILGIANSMVIGYGPPATCSRHRRGPAHGPALPRPAAHPRGAPDHRARGAGPPAPAWPAPGRRSSAAARWWSVVVVLGARAHRQRPLHHGQRRWPWSLLALSLIPLSGYARPDLAVPVHLPRPRGPDDALAVDGGGSVLGLLAAVGVCAGVGAVLALPVLRLRGLYLALATLAFAVLMDNVFFQSSSIMGVGGTVHVGRPDIFGMRFATDRVLRRRSSPSSWPCASSAWGRCAAGPSVAGWWA